MSDLSAGEEVWTSDGTAAGTFILKDINPGLGSGFGIGTPTALTNLGGILLFRALEPSTQNELWRSDGTPEGTVLVKDIYPGSVGSGPRDLRVVNGVAYFVAGDPAAGTELWKTDGTETGTVRVADIATGARSSDPDELTLAGERLYFTAFTARTGRELWALDSANICTTRCTALQGQTFRVRDPEPGVARRQRVVVVAEESGNVEPLLGDPTVSGAVMHLVADGASPSSQTFELPAAAWAASRRPGIAGFKYADRAGVHGPVSTVVLKRRASGAFTLKAKLRGGGAPLLVRPPAPGTGGRLYLRIQDGSGYCSRSEGTAGGRVRNVANQRFDVVGPTTVAGCP